MARKAKNIENVEKVEKVEKLLDKDLSNKLGCTTAQLISAMPFEQALDLISLLRRQTDLDPVFLDVYRILIEAKIAKEFANIPEAQKKMLAHIQNYFDWIKNA